jgi:hypothetical protein
MKTNAVYKKALKVFLYSVSKNERTVWQCLEDWNIRLVVSLDRQCSFRDRQLHQRETGGLTGSFTTGRQAALT